MLLVADTKFSNATQINIHIFGYAIHVKLKTYFYAFILAQIKRKQYWQPFVFLSYVDIRLFNFHIY